MIVDARTDYPELAKAAKELLTVWDALDTIEPPIKIVEAAA